MFYRTGVHHVDFRHKGVPPPKHDRKLKYDSLDRLHHAVRVSGDRVRVQFSMDVYDEFPQRKTVRLL